VLGILGVLSGITVIFFFMAFIFGVLALVFGLVARGRAAAGGRGMATAGTVLGGVSIAAGILGIVLIATIFNNATKHVIVRPGDFTVSQSTCEATGGTLEATGNITNKTGDSKIVVVSVDFVDTSGRAVGHSSTVDTVDGGASALYDIIDFSPSSTTESVTCRVTVT
jgi:hypothetical protein